MTLVWRLLSRYMRDCLSIVSNNSYNFSNDFVKSGGIFEHLREIDIFLASSEFFQIGVGLSLMYVARYCSSFSSNWRSSSSYTISSSIYWFCSSSYCCNCMKFSNIPRLNLEMIVPIFSLSHESTCRFSWWFLNVSWVILSYAAYSFTNSINSRFTSPTLPSYSFL